LRFGGMSLRMRRVELACWLAGWLLLVASFSVGWLGCLAAWAAALCTPGRRVCDWGALGVCCGHCLRGRKGAGGVGSDWAVMGGLLWKVMYVDLEPARR
jgi:hypothetical protein